MKRKTKVRRRDGLPPETNPAAAEPSGLLAPPGRSSIEQVDEHKIGSIESVPQTDPENGVAGFIEPEASEAGSTR